MGRRRPERDKAREIWEKSGGKKTIRELSEELGISQNQLRKWKSQDKWTPKKPRGAPKGNQNAKGHGPPKEKTGQGNRNAQTHGAYAKPDDANFTAEELEQLEGIQDEMLRFLVKKYMDLNKRIEALEEEPEEKFITGGIDGFNAMTFWDHKRKWIETLEERSLRIQSRIQKYIDQRQARESLEVHKELSMANLQLQREKAMGVFEDGDEEKEPPEA